MAKRIEKAAVIGAGAAGLWVANGLVRRGVEVVILDSGRVGAGSSFGNAGWICPPQAGPLPEPGLIRYGLRSLLDRRSALYISPTVLPEMTAWLFGFARRCNARDYEAGVRALAALGYPSFALIEEFLSGDEAAPGLDRAGLIVAAARPEPVQGFIDAIEPLRELGHELPDAPLSDEELAQLEPGLAGRATAAFVGDHWQLDPSKLTARLAARLRGLGVEIGEGERVTRIGRSASGYLVEHATGTTAADAVVLAAGSESGRLARSLGAPLPIRGGKGYSIDVEGPGWMPRHSMMFMDNHLAMSPLENGLRIAGTMEFSRNPGIDPARVEAMLRSARQVLGGWESARPPWAGHRPILPDGLPALGRLPGCGAAFAATGYSMLGMTISPAAGELLARQMVGEDPPELRPFDPLRLARRDRGRRGAGPRLRLPTRPR